MTAQFSAVATESVGNLPGLLTPQICIFTSPYEHGEFFAALLS